MTQQFNKSGSKYLRAVPCITDGKIDVYAVLDAFNVTCPARQHAIKKLLCSGIRGKGDVLQDLHEAADAANRAVQMEAQRQIAPACSCCAICAGYKCPKHAAHGTISQQEPTASLCPSCGRNAPLMYHGEYLKTKDGGCEGYCLPPITVPSPEEAVKNPLCDTCHREPCSVRDNPPYGKTCFGYIPEAKQEAPLPDMGCATTDCCNHSTTYLRNCAAYLPGAMRQCEKYTTANQEAPTAAEQTLDFTLPSIALKCTAEEAKEKYESEWNEWLDSEDGSFEELVERWDCLQALQTFYERGGNVDWWQTTVRGVMKDLTDCSEGRNVMGAKADMLIKNARRGYYRPEVNAEILASYGHSFTPKERKP